MRKWIYWLLALLPSYALPVEKFTIYYAHAPDPNIFAPYQLVVLEPSAKVLFQGLQEQGKTVLGYISLGEVSKVRPYFKRVKELGLLQAENPNWPGSFFVDLRKPAWTSLVLEELIPEILFQRYNGIFIDTIDNAEYMESLDPIGYQGMKKAAIDLIKSLRHHYPSMKIMLNRGYALLPEVAPYIDMVLGESVYADYDFKTKKYRLVEKPLYQQQVALLKKAMEINPAIKVYTLDYWDPKDIQGIKTIYAEQRKNGFIPYVSTLELDQIIPEPE